MHVDKQIIGEIMNTHSFLSHFHSLIPRRTAMILMALVMLTWSRPAFCDEIHDAVAKHA
jgi:hypothetical protein